MAEEEKEEESGGGEKKSSNLVLIIIIVVLVLVLVIGAVVAILMLSGDEEQMVEETSAKQEMRSNKRSEDVVGLTVGPMYPLEVFTVNLLSESGRRFLKAQINLELESEELTAELESKIPVIRDLIIKILTSRTLEEITTAKGKEKLKDNIVKQLNMRLRDGQLNNIYFTEFVIQ